MVFQSTPSAWRETIRILKLLIFWTISIHSLRMEGDGRSVFSRTAGRLFQSTPSAWRETLFSLCEGVIRWYFNPLPPHGGRRHCENRLHRYTEISIHSLRMEGDVFSRTAGRLKNVFQSTPSAWRETTEQVRNHHQTNYFNPLPPHGGRRYATKIYIRSVGISIHSLRMEGDRQHPDIPDAEDTFQSTPSAWRETYGDR